MSEEAGWSANHDDVIGGSPSSERPNEPSGDSAATLQQARRGAGIVTIAQLIGQVSRVITGMLILILLGPELSGVVQWVLVFSLFLDDVMRDVGFGAATIQKAENPERDELTSLFWVTAVIGVVTMGLLLLFGPTLADAVSHETGRALAVSVEGGDDVEAELGSMLQLVGVTFFVSSLATMNWAILRRGFEFTKVAVLNVVTAVLGGCLPLLLFWAGFGAWSVPWGIFLTSCTVTTLSFVFARFRPLPAFSWGHVRPHLGFSRDVTSGRVVSFAAANGDRFVVGGVLGNLALGFYGFAFRVVMAPVQLLASVSTELLFPTLSRLQSEPAALSAALRRAAKLAAVVITVPMVALAVSAEPAIAVVSDVRGDDWSPAEPLVAILAIVAIPQAIMSVVLPAMIAAGKTTRMFLWSTVAAVAAVVAYLIGAQFGLTEVAWAFLIVMVVLFVPHLEVVGRCAGVSAATFLRDLAPIGMAGAVGALAGAGVGRLVDTAPPLLDLAVRGVVASIAAGVTLVVLRQRVLVDLVGFVPGAGRLRAVLDRHCTRGIVH